MIVATVPDVDVAFVKLEDERSRGHGMKQQVIQYGIEEKQSCGCEALRVKSNSRCRQEGIIYCNDRIQMFSAKVKLKLQWRVVYYPHHNEFDDAKS